MDRTDGQEEHTGLAASVYVHLARHQLTVFIVSKMEVNNHEFLIARFVCVRRH